MDLAATRDVLVEVDVEGADEIGRSVCGAANHYVLSTATRTNLKKIFKTIDGKVNTS